MHRITIGKLRGIQQLANERGIFTMVAADQRSSLRKMLCPDHPGSVPSSRLTEIKVDIAHALSPRASAFLTDPEYGAGQAIAAQALRGSCGLLVALEDGDFEWSGGEPRARILDGWSVGGIKRMGASGVKFLAYFRPDAGLTTVRQRDLIARVGEECCRHDIAFVLETLVYPKDGISAGSTEYAAEKPELVIENARMLRDLGADLYKAEFPAHAVSEADDATLLRWCQDLSAACQIPWVVLSAGVGSTLFRRQVQLACQGGASGFLAGRSIWQEAALLPPEQRQQVLQTTAAENLNSLIAIANTHAHPWMDRARSVFAYETVDPRWYRTAAHDLAPTSDEAK